MPDDPHDLSLAAIHRIDRLCDEFEEGWTRERPPRIEDFLGDVSDEERPVLFRSLLQIELELLRHSGSRPARGPYLRRFVPFAEIVRAVFSEPQTIAISRKESRASGGEAPVPSAAAAGLSGTVVLTVVKGPHAGLKYAFDRHDTFLAGRSRKTHLCLRKDPHFSRNHFRIEFNPPECYLADLGSRNGTYVNGSRVQEAFLKSGDIISGGRTELQVSVLPPVSIPVAGQAAGQVAALPGNADDGQSAAARFEQRGSLPLIPDYDVLAEIGRGAMGVVYRAVQKSTSREVALKLVIPARETRDQLLQLFVREASILSQLRHPLIVRFHEIGMAGGQLFIAMEYVKTLDLAQLLNQATDSKRVQIACRVARDVLSALRYAHSESLVHRDIKPANILLERSGNRARAKLADFGLAKNFENAGFSDVTREGADPRGSAAYMAPEQVMNCRYARPACDLYAVGATLYHYLSGSLPFDFSTGRSKFAIVLEDEPIPLETHGKPVPPELAAVVYKALSKDPADRFASAAEMRDALQPFAQRVP